jgi:exodeoxyribonuclease VII large subunit
MSAEPLTLSVSEFVAYANQTLEYAYPSIVITGELANFRVSKNRWVYFDLKDEGASVRFFGTVYQLNGPLEDGMMLQVRGAPRLHPQFGFSITVQQLALVGKGTIKRASDLLQAKLAKEGLFDSARKRTLPYPPKKIGLITSGESAAYADFTKICSARWAGLDITLADVQVQGMSASEQIERAIHVFNQLPEPPEVLVLIRGGGSADDLQAFSEERVVRAVAASRIPTLVAIGHEIDTSLAELAADTRASTPSNAAELLTPDKTHVLQSLTGYQKNLHRALRSVVEDKKIHIQQSQQLLAREVQAVFDKTQQQLRTKHALLDILNPQSALQRGYAVVRLDGAVVKSGEMLQKDAIVRIELHDATVGAKITDVKRKGDV